MKTENNHKKDYRKKIEDQLTNLVEAHLSGINKNAASKLSKTIGSAVKQIAKKFYKTHFSIESQKNEEIISKIIKAKSIKRTTASSKAKPTKVSKAKPKAIKAKSVKPAKPVVKKAAVAKARPSAKKTTPAKAKPVVKKTVKAVVKKVAKPIAAAKKLSSIPKEFMGSISKKTAKK